MTRLVQLYSRSMLKFLNVTCIIEAEPGRDFDTHAGMLIIPNHMSYLDVLVINALFPAVFVTSREIEQTPVLGQITTVAGCTFIERRHKQSLHRDIDRLSALLNDGVNVTLFPEGTTTAGDIMLPFKKSLFEAAIRSKARVVPVCLRYETINGEPFSRANHDTVAWYGDMSFLPHLLKLVSVSEITVRLTVLPDMEFRGHRSRKKLADATRKKIADCYFS